MKNTMETYFSKKAVLLSWPHFKAEAERCQLANQRSSFRREKSERATQPDGGPERHGSPHIRH